MDSLSRLYASTANGANLKEVQETAPPAKSETQKENNDQTKPKSK